MRVLLSAFQCGPGFGSEPGNGWHWATALAEHGHEVTVLTTSDEKEAVLAADPQGIDFRFIDLQKSPQRHFSRHLARYPVYLRWQEDALRHVERTSQQYDVAHHVTFASLHLGSMLWRLPVPLVYGPIGGGQLFPVNYWRYFSSKLPWEIFRSTFAGPLLPFNRWSRDTLRNSAVTLVANSPTAASARRQGAADVRFMMADALPPEWINEARMRPSGTPVVLCVGRLLPHKAPVLAVRAFAILRRTMAARLVFVGQGPLAGEVRAAAERLGVAQDVELLGRLPTLDDVKHQYDSATAFLFTSLRDTFGAPFLEALGRGLPAVAVDLNGIADADTGPAALKVALTRKPSDLPGRIASALQTVLSDDKWESRSAAAIKWASEQVWPVRAAAATQLYREIAGSQRGPG
jgi:glycosyltransferase involved in cell wall biosynthesis